MNDQTVRVLLVEDNPHDVELTLRAFRKSNLANPIQILGDGAAALEYLFGTGAYAGRDLRDGPDVILLDLKLPKISGMEVLRRVKSDSRTRSIPVVMLTSSREDSDIRECYELGVNSYIVKPVEFNNFSESIRTLGFYWLLLNQPPRP